VKGVRMSEQATIGDLLYGAAAISRFVFGNEEDRRKVYCLANSGSIPTFKMGAVLCGRRSSIAAAIAEKERVASPPSQASHESAHNSA
jgi:hypothetical protein